MTPFPLPVTAWTAVLLGILFMWLTFRVIGHRRAHAIVHGDGNDKVMMKKVRGHANAAEQIPLALILLAFTEALLGTGWVAVVISAMLVIGRTIHGAYFAVHGLPHQMRVGGMLLSTLGTIFAIIAVATGLLMQ